MPILYRSPNVTIDSHDWHVTVEKNPRSGRVITVYRWRPTRSDRPIAWRPISSWQGRKPKGLWWYFRFAQHSIAMARRAAA